MKIYLAGIYAGGRGAIETTSENIAATMDLFYPYVLESFHYIGDGRVAGVIREKKETIFLDSGAYSMFTQKVEVSLEKFAEFIKTNQDIIHIASNLDVIGHNSEEGTYQNQKALEKMGVTIQPVCHARDADKWIEKYLAEGYDYIFLGGMVPETTPYLIQWLDHVWEKYFTNKDGTAKVKVHGFGLTTAALMWRYPWYSVDSTSWVMTSRFGSIYLDLPHGDFKIAFSDQSPSMKTTDRHYDTLDPTTKRVVDERLAELGYDPQLLRTHYGWRDHANITYFERCMLRPDPIFKRREKTLF